MALEIFGVIFALLYLWLGVRQNFLAWVAGFVSSLAYVFIFHQNQIYANAGLYVYYVLMSVYGFYSWRWGGRGQVAEQGDDGAGAGDGERRELSVSRARWVHWLVLTPIAAAVFPLLYYILRHHTDSPIPLGDALTTALSIVATWMLARKLLEQWLLWIFINFVSAGLYFYIGIYPTAALFVVYGIISVYGYFKWKKTIAI